MVTSLTSLSLLSTELVPAEEEDLDFAKFKTILDKWLVESRERSRYDDATRVARTMEQKGKRSETTLLLDWHPYIEYLPEDALCMMTHLTDIVFHDLPQCRFPRTMRTLTTLTRLIFASYGYVFPQPWVPIPVRELTNLRVLGLNHNKLEIVPSGIFGLTGLVELSMMQQNLKSLPTALATLTNLTRLDFSTNSIEDPPSELSVLTQLREFDLRGNPVQGIPPEYGRLTKLTELKFGRQYRWLPLSVKFLPCMEKGGFQLSTLIEQFEVSAARPLFLKISFLTGDQERYLVEWLLRLARTEEYYDCQSQVAGIVCTMLHTMGFNKEFRDAFFHVITFRAYSEELLFDELYVLLENMTYYSNQPIQFKLDKLGGVARTIALRKELESRTRHLSEEQKIEAFHTAEKSFYEELGLKKAILQSGEVYVIDSSDELRMAVDAQYKQILLTLPSYGFIK